MMSYSEAMKILNLLGLIMICIILGITLYLDAILNQTPCPLCILQRLGMIGVGIGLLMNLKFGISSKYYSLSLFNAIFGAAVAIRHILLHIVPGTGSYGAPILGLHLYTWSFIGFVGMILYLIFLSALGSQNSFKSKP